MFTSIAEVWALVNLVTVPRHMQLPGEWDIITRNLKFRNPCKKIPNSTLMTIWGQGSSVDGRIVVLPLWPLWLVELAKLWRQQCSCLDCSAQPNQPWSWLTTLFALTPNLQWRVSSNEGRTQNWRHQCLNVNYAQDSDTHKHKIDPKLLVSTDCPDANHFEDRPAPETDTHTM
jgi:hypothetical protein